MECGIPIGWVFFIARITSFSEKTLFPTMLIWPTLTLGPSSMLKITSRELGGMRRMSGSTLANWRPRSPSNSFNTTAARCTWFGSYWDSTERPTFRSLNRSRISETVTDLAPSYLMSADHRALRNYESHDDARRAWFRLQPDIVETFGIP